MASFDVGGGLPGSPAAEHHPQQGHRRMTAPAIGGVTEEVAAVLPEERTSPQKTDLDTHVDTDSLTTLKTAGGSASKLAAGKTPFIVIAGVLLVGAVAGVIVAVAGGGSDATQPAGQAPSGQPPAPPAAAAALQLAHGLVVPATDGALLELSGANSLATLSRVPAGGGAPVPAGRSYDGRDWESVHPDLLAFDCGGANAGSACSADLSKAANAAHYRVEVYSGASSIPSAEQLSAYFLIQATFGPTRQTIQSLSAGMTQAASSVKAKIEDWIQAQISLQPNYHRAYYRQRVNPRQQAPVGSGAAKMPCDIGSRWHNFAFTGLDIGRNLTVTPLGGGGFKVKVDGVVRTEISSFSLDASSAHAVCEVAEYVGGDVKIGPSCTAIPNPALSFAAGPPSGRAQIFASTSHATFATISGGTGQYVSSGIPAGFRILEAMHVACTLPAAGVAFLKYDGQYYMHDRRLSLVTNTLTTPANMSAEAAHATICPAVQKNLFNSATCARRQACAAMQYSSVSFQLDTANLRAFFEVGGKYVYRVEGLRLEDTYAVSPCSAVSRWYKHSSACGAGVAGTATALDSATKSTISGYINSASGNVVRDIEVVTGTCNSLLNGVSAIGARIQISGACWEHVHPHLYNVYDFSYWSEAHDGNGEEAARGNFNPIRKHAEQSGSVVLPFPGHHVMKRWKDKQALHTYIGRWGDTVDFRFLASSVQTPALAVHFGAISSAVAEDGSEACGSRAEVANDPKLDHRYHMHVAEETKQTYDLPEAGLFKKYRDFNGKSMVFTNVVLTAPDQLRQRVAWALSQVKSTHSLCVSVV